MKKIEMIIQCQACNGTGVYSGCGEGRGAAVVCYRCKGTGEYNYRFEYEEFTGKKKAEGIKRVYKSGYGYKIGTGLINFDRVGLVDMDNEGVSYDEFMNGKLPGHIKRLACPMLADQSKCHDIKGFTKECDKLHGSTLLGISLSRCNNQINKGECWERFDSSS